MKFTWRASLGVTELCVLFCADRILKWWAMNRLSDSGSFIIKDTLGFTLERNQGISYSIPLPQTLLLVLLALIIVILICLAVMAYRRHDWPAIFPLALIIIGAFSNALDRLKWGYVVDYVTLTGWPVFNIADIAILAGAIWLVIRVMRQPAIR
jgi:signal peptidase II